MRLEGSDAAQLGPTFAHHMPDDREIGAENAAEWFEDRVGAERDIVPCEVGTTAAEDDCETDRGYNACTGQLLAGFWERRMKKKSTHARPIQKIKVKIIFFFACNWRCQIIGTGMRKIQISVMRFEMFVKYVNVTMTRHFPVTFASQ